MTGQIPTAVSQEPLCFPRKSTEGKKKKKKRQIESLRFSWWYTMLKSIKSKKKQLQGSKEVAMI